MFKRLIIVILFSGTMLYSQQVPGLTHTILDNGMEIFLLENHTVPLTTIQITFRCGALTQTPHTAGLFHLYEHMLFKGNEKYPTQSEFMAAMKSLGVGDWNGGTATEYVTYHFTIPSEKTREGITFWADAVRYPLLSGDELEAEKEVVINEIKGYHNDPADNFRSAVSQKLFYKYPWRRDVSGPIANIENCTVEQMQAIQDFYYTPENSALFVAGDIDPQELELFIEDLFSDWQQSLVTQEKVAPHPFMEESQRIVFQEPAMYPGFSKIEVYQRGPDVLDDPKATFAADVLLTLLESPESRFRKSIFEKVPSLYAPEHIWKSYYTQKDGGQIFFGAYSVIDDMTNPYEVAELFSQAVNEEIQTIIDTPDYFDPEEFTLLKSIIEDQRILSQEVPSSFISSFSFWWASASTDYYEGYIENLRKVDHEEIASYLRDYILNKPTLLTVQMSPDLYDKHKADKGFEEITQDSAYWWQNK